MVPVEQFAAKNRTCSDGAMLKRLYYDSVNITHVNSSSDSVDAANCYDAVNHPIVSLALRSTGVSKPPINAYLRAMQTMEYFLRTAYGLSEEGHGGTEVVPYMGLSQGSCASPPVWTAVSTVVVRAYRQEGFGVELKTAWSGLIIVVAAVLFVDDTDLFNVCKNPEWTEEQFINFHNRAIYFWAKLLQATGGNLKQAKCYYYLMVFRFRNGKAYIASPAELAGYPVATIPQHSGPDLPIDLLPCTEATETLGVIQSPTGLDTGHLQKMQGKAYEWLAKVNDSNLSPQEVWHSMLTQAIPSVRYGMLVILNGPRTVEDTFMKWYFNSLPRLGVNRNITADWRWLPKQYQGLGLPNFGIEKAVEMIQYMFRHWGSKEGVGLVLRRDYELLQLEIGLEGNFLTRDYRKYGFLASSCWVKTLWQYCYYYNVQLEIDDMCIPPPRERDFPIMEKLIHLFEKPELDKINRVRHYKEIYWASQMVEANGGTVHGTAMGRSPGISTTMDFPTQQPTSGDFSLWETAVRLITSPSLELSPPLGKMLNDGYGKVLWWKGSSDIVYRSEVDNPITRAYRLDETRRATRSTTLLIEDDSVTNDPPRRKRSFVSVRFTSDGSPCYHSECLYKVFSHEGGRSPMDLIQESNFASLFKHANIPDGGRWITEGLQRGSIVSVHDGSYQEDVDSTACSTALVIYCTHSKKQGIVPLAEQTGKDTASNYRGEALGALLNAVLLRVCTHQTDLSYKLVRTGCDNMGIVNHASDFKSALPDKQKQADVLPTEHESKSTDLAHGSGLRTCDGPPGRDSRALRSQSTRKA